MGSHIGGKVRMGEEIHGGEAHTSYLDEAMVPQVTQQQWIEFLQIRHLQHHTSSNLAL